mmetsp:Transcript_71871/g.186924  ORF Transcript_71871/g.186924 Transcript_71871/m.186924 type:complete len:246 (-) Transcript_71871:32-769(-)
MVAVRVSCAVRHEWRPHVDFVEVREGALQYINDNLDLAVADEHRVQRHESDGPLLDEEVPQRGHDHALVALGVDLDETNTFQLRMLLPQGADRHGTRLNKVGAGSRGRGHYLIHRVSSVRDLNDTVLVVHRHVQRHDSVLDVRVHLQVRRELIESGFRGLQRNDLLGDLRLPQRRGPDPGADVQHDLVRSEALEDQKCGTLPRIIGPRPEPHVLGSTQVVVDPVSKLSDRVPRRHAGRRSSSSDI